MRQIPLTQGKFALVDDEDFEELNKRKWCLSHGYAVSALPRGGKKTQNGRIIRMHRVIMNVPAGTFIDHKNGDKTDNRKSNLRVCTRAQNIINSNAFSNNKFGLRGIVFHKQTGKWRARIGYEKKALSLGLFNTKEDAHNAYTEAAIKLYNEFAFV